MKIKKKISNSKKKLEQDISNPLNGSYDKLNGIDLSIDQLHDKKIQQKKLKQQHYKELKISLLSQEQHILHQEINHY